MKKLFMIILLAIVFVSCRGKDSLSELKEIKIDLSKNPKLESLINDINKNDNHSALILNKDSFLFVYNNPNSKVKDYKLKINKGELYIDLEDAVAHDEPLRFYEVAGGSHTEEYLKKYSFPKKIHILKNGKDLEVVYFENVEIK
ncbi:hypothetical protein WKS98_02825 [Lagierella sp. ICN-221743]